MKASGRKIVCREIVSDLAAHVADHAIELVAVRTSDVRRPPEIIVSAVKAGPSVRGPAVIELDGGQHSEQSEADQKRSAFMESHGFRVLRFWNDQVLTDTDGVLEQILAALDEGAHR